MPLPLPPQEAVLTVPSGKLGNEYYDYSKLRKIDEMAEEYLIAA